ncbi:MAG: YidC/Oxa1 family membrane protein insertase, partial [Longicatena sp.]
ENGKTYVNSIIAVKDETVKRKEVDIPNDKKIQEKYKGLKDDDTISIKKTSFSEALDEGWFNGLIVWPIAQLINITSSWTDAGMGIIITTFLIQLLIFLFSIKSQVASQRMQSIQPEINKIQAKYAGKSDDRSKMMQAQEMQAIYKKYKINPFGTLLTTFIQFPVIFGMYYATMRAFAVVSGTFFGVKLTLTPLEGFNEGSVWHVVVFLLMVVFQLLSFKMPQWLQAHKKKKDNVKEKKYAEPTKKASGMMGSMNMMMYMSTAMITIFAINWPLAMSFYWLVNSVFRVIQNIVIHKFFIKD